MSTGTTYDFTCTRDKLIELAHKVIGVLEPGQPLDGDQLNDGVTLLGLIVRETDASGKWRWTVGDAKHVPLAANTAVYTSANGLPTNIAELHTASYRDASGNDWPMTILTAEKYEEITGKAEVGQPEKLYLSEDITLASRVLYVWRMLSSVTAQSVVTGSDAQVYRCTRAHMADAVNHPVSGANWRLFWELGGSSPSAWASGASYTAPDQIRISYRRPLFDFDTAADTPDFPMQWPRLLLYKLAFDLGDIWGIPVEERNNMIQKAKGAYQDVFPSLKNKTNNVHNKVKFF